MRRHVEEKRHEHQIQRKERALERSEDVAILRDLSSVVLSLLLGLERRNPRNREKPVEHASEHEEVVRRAAHPHGGDRGPGEKGRSRERSAREQETLESDDDRRILELEPLELKRSPASDEERGLGAEKRREEAEGEGIEGGEEGGGEEEGDLGRDERHPYPEEGSELDVEGIDDVGDEEADGEGGDHRSAAEVEEEGGAGDEGESDASVVGEGGWREARVAGSRSSAASSTIDEASG